MEGQDVPLDVGVQLKRNLYFGKSGGDSLLWTAKRAAGQVGGGPLFDAAPADATGTLLYSSRAARAAPFEHAGLLEFTKSSVPPFWAARHTSSSAGSSLSSAAGDYPHHKQRRQASALITTRRDFATRGAAELAVTASNLPLLPGARSLGKFRDPVIKSIEEEEDEAFAAAAEARRAAVEEEVEQRVQAWYSMLLNFRRNPECINFVYLTPARPNAVEYHPYDLRLVTHAEVNPHFYYTMSAQGVTNFYNGETTHATLDEFERDYFLYKQTMKLRLFATFRKWKTFQVWRYSVRRGKARHARKALEKRLFSSSPWFREGLAAVRADCCSLLESLSGSALRPGVSYSLDAFKEAQEAVQQGVTLSLDEFQARALRHVQRACTQAMAVLDSKLSGIVGGIQAEEAELARYSVPKAHRDVQERFPVDRAKLRGVLGAAAPRVFGKKMSPLQRRGPDSELSHAVSAARRTERRRIVAFVKLCDYVVASTLREALLLRGQCALRALHLSTPPVAIGDADGARELTNAAEDSEAQNRHVFEMDVLLVSGSGDDDGERHEFAITPAAEEFVAEVERGLHAMQQAALGVVQLARRPELQSYVQVDDDVLRADVSESTRDIVVDPVWTDQVEAVVAASTDMFDRAREYCDSLSPLRAMFAQTQAFSLPALAADFEAGCMDLERLREAMWRYQQHVRDVDDLAPVHRVDALQLRLERLRESLRPAPVRCYEQCCELLPRLAGLKYEAFMREINTAVLTLSRVPTSAEEFGAHLRFLAACARRKPEFDALFDDVAAHFDMCKEFRVPMDEVEAAKIDTMEEDYQSLRDAMWSADSTRDRHALKFRGELDKQVVMLNRQVLDIRLMAQHEMLLDPATRPDEALKYSQRLREQAREFVAEADGINSYQELFRVEKTEFAELQDTVQEIELKETLWRTKQEFAAAQQRWLGTAVSAVDARAMDDGVAAYGRVCHRLERGLVPNSVVPQLREAVDVWKAAVAVLQALGSPDMKERHWLRVEEAIGVKIVRDESFIVRALFETRLLDQKDRIVAIATDAAQEAALELDLGKVVERWGRLEFEVKRHRDAKDTFILGSVEDIVAQLEESNMAMMTITASRYVAGIRNEVDALGAQLRLFGDTLDEWLEVQRTWLYLENIFGAQDIQRQLPTESVAFSQVDRDFKQVMRATRERPNALQAGTFPGRLELLRRCNAALEGVQKSLQAYLETKRSAFPRFYFISDDELLDILSQGKRPAAVQPHLGKCFDGIRQLELEGEGRAPDVVAMLSGEGERVLLGKNLKARGPVEVWLTAVEASMRSTLRSLGKQALREHGTMPRAEWIRLQPAQLAVAVNCVVWCQQVEQCLAGPQAPLALKRFLDSSIAELNDLTALVSTPLAALARRVAVALITIDVHNRDIVAKLAAQGCAAVGDFAWQMQLRYGFDAEESRIVVQQVNAHFDYSYEYLGAQPRLVVTPMTDRCYLTLTGALHLHLGGAPAGPAGTGKTETTKDLGKALGVLCIVFNCGENLDFRFMGKFFAGLAQCGAWACFDEFNRIDVEVLSVVAQQLLTIQNALRARVQSFAFEGRVMRLVPSCGVFITMNPGYAGRTELPDNLKALFRPMSMMIPDYALVAEVMLFSEGFQSAQRLSRKMVQLYKLASEQLSHQPHYDFGMRALKSVLVMAGALKRAEPARGEDMTLIRAMRDSNIPKLLAADADVFDAIVSDLFPGVSLPRQDHGLLETELQACSAADGLQPAPAFVTKCVQLYETLAVRFGVMLVGPAGGGKSCIARTLRAAMTQMHVMHGHPSFQRVSAFPLNPKAVSMGELYGEYNRLSNEWRDGLASSIMRAAAANDSPTHEWVVFDGPVDAVWVENMNTVLDDNCLLCLPNGERIKLDSATMRVLFEVADLAVASPATVSRCGMLYVPAEGNGWRQYVASWLARLPVALAAALPHADRDASPGVAVAPQLVADIEAHFEAYLDAGLAWIRKHGREDVQSVDVQLAASVCLWTQALLHPAGGFDHADAYGPASKVALGYVFAFAFVWGLGGGLAGECWDAWDAFVRRLFDGVANFPQGSGSVFEFCLDPERNFALQPWSERVPEFVYAPEQPYLSITVPTVDTLRYSTLLRTALEHSASVLLLGESGVGKSVVVRGTLDGCAGPLKLVPTVINFSARSGAAATQEAIEGGLEKVTKTVWGAPAGKRVALFIDDLNMPAREVYGAQPPVELLRQLKDLGGLHDRAKLHWKEVRDVVMLGACGPPGGGRQPLTQRFTRHFHALCMRRASDTTMRHIFAAVVQGFLGLRFPPEVRAQMLKPLVQATVELFERVCAEFLPTPSKMHYTFNLRDVSKVFQGILDVRPGSCGRDPAHTLELLWVHENMRVFHDRLTCDEDRRQLQTMLHGLLQSRFQSRLTFADVFERELPLLFGDFMKMGVAPDERSYELINDASKLTRVLENYLEDYNAAHPAGMQLSFFTDAIQHVARLARVLRQPRGNAVLVGVGGSGKRSLARFASHVADCRCVQLRASRGFGQKEFREALMGLYEIAGVEGGRVVFLVTEEQIVHESFMEDINNILSSGEVPGLFQPDDRERVFNSIRPWIQTLGLEETRGKVFRAFIDRVRANLHVVLCVSPVGDAFRDYCRQFPALVNCCTIDWYSPWPTSALTSVATQFFKKLDFGADARARDAVTQLCTVIHASVGDAAGRFYEELRRRVYTTPKSFLDLLALYAKLLGEKRGQLAAERSRVALGLRKLRETNEVVAAMQTELRELEPQLAAKTAATQELLAKVSREQADAAEIQAMVSAEEEEVSARTKETQALKDDAQVDLEAVLPALLAAEKALSALNKNDIIEIKTFQKPPALVQVTMEAVCLLLNEKADWEGAKKVLSDANFLKRLVEFDRDGLGDRQIRQIAPIIENPAFTADQVAKQSKAAMSMCLWVRAMDTYAKVSKVVEPKRRKLWDAEESLRAMNGQLAAKQAQLRDVRSAVDALTDNLRATQSDLEALQAHADLSSRRLGRAGQLTHALSDEGVRWEGVEAAKAAEEGLVVGDVLLSAACISYLGPFTAPHRAALVARWLAECGALAVAASPQFSLQRTLSSPIEMRSWMLQGLPSDDLSVDNAILATRCHRWPLLIDPQLQGAEWIRRAHGHAGVRTLRASDPGLLRALEACVRAGAAALLEDVAETLEPALEPLLQKQIVSQGNRTTIRLGDAEVDYDARFRLYLVTKLPNPHFLPETCIKVTVVNFTVTPPGLREQLLADTVRRERPALEEQRDALVTSIAHDRRMLADLEDKILKLLQESSGNILDDEALIATLNSSKATSAVIKERVVEAEATEALLDAARREYSAVPARGSVLFFAIASLAAVDPMYQYSLAYFKQLFGHCLDTADAADELPERLQNLMRHVTAFLYRMVCRGLFERHKLMFSFVICTSIQREGGQLEPAEWNYLLRGGPASPSPPRNPDASFIAADTWAALAALEAGVRGFEGLLDGVARETAAWREYALSAAPWSVDPPAWGAGRGGAALSPMQRLLLARCWQEHSLQSAVQAYIRAHLGDDFVGSPPARLGDVYADTTPATPVIFILSQGVDPTATLQRFGEAQGYAAGERLRIISLGQGQGPVAEGAIATAKAEGHWVCLQNCHLARSWMPTLQAIVAGLAADERVHPGFRLWLTSMPAPSFPVQVLQCGLKVTMEPPSGIRGNLQQSLADLAPGALGGADEPPHPAWRPLLFSCALFHAVVQGRRKFGALGWNVRYDFSAGDLSCALLTLRSFLDEGRRGADASSVPWEALTYVTGEIVYGGRVTDDNDRRLLMSLLSLFLAPQVLRPGYAFSEAGAYLVPSGATVEQWMEAAAALPAHDAPELFGLNGNAEIAFQAQASRELIDTVLSLQPRAAGATVGLSPEEVARSAASELLRNLPPPLDVERASKTRDPFKALPCGAANSLGTVLRQEVQRFNALQATLSQSLRQLLDAVAGKVTMSADLEAMMTAILNNQVPPGWARAAYPSLKPLATWTADFAARVAFVRGWLEDGAPASFWLPGLFFPQTLLTGVLQNHARSTRIAIDRLAFAFSAAPILRAADVSTSPATGCYCHGLFLEAARWDVEFACVKSAKPGEMFSPLPVIHFEPRVDSVPDGSWYQAPLYKTTMRAGVLSTTGHSTNFVLHMSLPIAAGTTPDFWTRQGVAVICAP